MQNTSLYLPEWGVFENHYDFLTQDLAIITICHAFNASQPCIVRALSVQTFDNDCTSELHNATPSEKGGEFSVASHLCT